MQIKKETKYVCSYCGKEFVNEAICKSHEENGCCERQKSQLHYKEIRNCGCCKHFCESYYGITSCNVTSINAKRGFVCDSFTRMRVR